MLLNRGKEEKDARRHQHSLTLSVFSVQCHEWCQHSHGFVDIYTDDDNGHNNGAKNGEGQFDARHNSETSKQNTGAYKGS